MLAYDDFAFFFIAGALMGFSLGALIMNWVHNAN